MLIGELKPNMQVGSGVTVRAVKRGSNGFTTVTLSTGRKVTLHKSRHVAELFIGHLPARTLGDSPAPKLRDVRVTSREWRGERDGKQGDRITVTIAAYSLIERRA